MQTVNLKKCPSCNARVNPLWQACLACGHSLQEALVTYEDKNLFASILRMPLSKFKTAGLLVRVRCRHLNDEEIFIASSEKEASIGRAEGLVCYTADELIQLVNGKPSPEELKSIHNVKKILQGTLIQTKDKEDQ